MGPADSAAARTTQKLRFAQIVIDELRTHPSRHTGNDFERSHHEAFLFHLYGAVDAFLHEINAHYAGGLAAHEVRFTALLRVFRQRQQQCPELQEIAARCRFAQLPRQYSGHPQFRNASRWLAHGALFQRSK